MKDLSECRREIDELDSELLTLLEKRIRVAENVAKYKLENGIPVFDEAREKAVLAKIGAASPKDVEPELVGTYDGIMNMSKLHQYQLKSEYSKWRTFFEAAIKVGDGNNSYDGAKIGVQGVDGAFSAHAAREMFKKGELVFYSSWEEIFVALKAGDIDFGVLPVENSTYGSVTDVYHLIMDNDAYIVASHRLPVEHCLLAKAETKESDIREVFSHPQAIGQCSDFITKAGYIANKRSNTAISAELVAKSERTDIAAIASMECGEIYGLKILRRGIQNERGNTTRFVAISGKPSIGETADKISIQFSLAHQNGTLSRILGYFAALGLNLTKIESCPIPEKPFEYRFYLDFNGTMRDSRTFNLICALSDELSDFRFLGNYAEGGTLSN